MSRQPRILYENAFYHVMNRGQDRRSIYVDDKDRRRFLWLLSDFSKEYAVSILAYCLMGNHYHLLVQTPRANLPEFMKALGSAYVLRYNKRHHKDGPLFRGRYTAKPVQNSIYLLRVLKYIHFNPLHSQKRVKDLYPRSSHQHYIGKKKISFVDDNEIVRQLRVVKMAYQKFMHDTSDRFEEILQNRNRSFILGDDDFCDQITCQLTESVRRWINPPPDRSAINR